MAADMMTWEVVTWEVAWTPTEPVRTAMQPSLEPKPAWNALFHAVLYIFDASFYPWLTGHWPVTRNDSTV